MNRQLDKFGEKTPMWLQSTTHRTRPAQITRHEGQHRHHHHKNNSNKNTSQGRMCDKKSYSKTKQKMSNCAGVP
jgi:hypothetical protein